MAALQHDMASTYTPRGFPSHQRRSAQVIIVGAGLSGLQAAYNLQRAGATCLVLEARDSIGRCSADDSFSASNHPRVAQLAMGLGLDVEVQNGQGKDVVEGLDASLADGTPNLSDEDNRSFIRVRDNLEELCQRVDVNRPAQLLPNYGPMTAHELVVSQGATPLVQKLANSWTSAIFGLGSRDVSALYFLLHCKCAGGLLQVLSEMRGGGQRLSVAGGAERLCEELAARLQPGSVRFSHVVERVDQTCESKVVVTRQSGEVFYCTKVVAAAVDCAAIEFTPELSEDKRRVLGIEAGFSRRVALLYGKPWWQDRGLSGCAQGLSGPVSVIKATARDGFYTLTCSLTGESGREVWQMEDGERQRALLSHVEAIFGDSLPTPFEVEDVSTAPMPLAVPAADLRSLERDHWQPEGSVFFAGAETSYSWRGHAEGALASGSLVAEEVMAALQTNSEAMFSRL